MAAIASHSTLFERTMDNLDLPKSDVNNLIMNYLITEGYPSAAQKFATEANIELGQDHTSITERVNIRDLIHQGKLQQAIEAINELDIVLLDRNKKLHFSLLRLQLIEMIKQSFVNNDPVLIGSALEFATNNLSPYTLGSDQFRVDLERAMALLIVPKETWMNPQAGGGFGSLAELVHPDLRRKIAREVNEAILKSQGRRPEAHVNYLVKTRAWAENQAREKKIDLPNKLDIGLTTGNDQTQSSNGHGDGGDTEMSENGAGTDSDLMRYTNIES